MLAFFLVKNDLPSACESWHQFILQLGLAALFFAVGAFFFLRGRAGKIHFEHWLAGGPKSKKGHQKLAMVISAYIWTLAVVTLLSTLLGWGC